MVKISYSNKFISPELIVSKDVELVSNFKRRLNREKIVIKLRNNTMLPTPVMRVRAIPHRYPKPVVTYTATCLKCNEWVIITNDQLEGGD